MSTYSLCFELKYDNYQNFLSKNFHFLVIKFSMYLNRRLFVMSIYIYFSQKIGFDISCKLFPKETICMKCPNLFSWKKKKINIINLSVTELTQRAVTLKGKF